MLPWLVILWQIIYNTERDHSHTEKMLKLSCVSDSELHDYYVITKYLPRQHSLIDTPIVLDVTAP